MSADQSGAWICAVFGLIFVLANAGSLPGPIDSLLQGIAFAVVVAIVLTLRRRSGRPSSPLRSTGLAFGRGYWVIVAGEVSAIALGLIVLAGPLDAPQASVAWIALVVGVHVFALAALWRRPFLHLLGAGLATCGAAGLVLAATGAADAAIAATAGVVPGALLLASSVYRDGGDLPDREPLARAGYR